MQNSTQLRRETVSYADGRYDVPELPVGVYTITFEHPGFKTLSFVDVEQVIGRTRTLDASLQVSGSEERVEVNPASALFICYLREPSQTSRLTVAGAEGYPSRAVAPASFSQTSEFVWVTNKMDQTEINQICR